MSTIIVIEAAKRMQCLNAMLQLKTQVWSEIDEREQQHWIDLATVALAAPLQDDLAHPERLKALSDAADYVDKIGARYHSGRDIANGIRCLAPQGTGVVVEEPAGAQWTKVPNRDQVYSVVLQQLETKRRMPTSVSLAVAIADAVANLFSQVERPKASDYSAWLVEINEPVSGPLYYQLEDDNDWTMDHDKALHFARKEDAERTISYYGWTRAAAVEHMWPEALSAVKGDR